MLVVHPHFHGRYTGASRHVETMLRAFSRSHEARTMGRVIDGAMPRIAHAEILRRAATEPVIWHAHRVHELLAGLSLRAVRRNIRVVFTRHSLGSPSALTRWAAAKADARIAVSPETARDFGLPSEVVLHGIDLSRFHPGDDRDAAWARLGLGGRYGMAVVGRIRPDKGVGDLLDAALPLLRANPAWRLVLIGLVKPKHRAWLSRKLAEASGAVVEVGEQRNIEEWYRALTVVVSPSHEESFGLVRAEALASGCCLLATRLNAFDAKLEDGRNALLYDKGDQGALRSALSKVFETPERAAAIGAAGAAFARAHLAAEAQAQQLERIYRRLVEARP